MKARYDCPRLCRRGSVLVHRVTCCSGMPPSLPKASKRPRIGDQQIKVPRIIISRVEYENFPTPAHSPHSDDGCPILKILLVAWGGGLKKWLFGQLCHIEQPAGHDPCHF
jgi:hypothetical protein